MTSRRNTIFNEPVHKKSSHNYLKMLIPGECVGSIIGSKGYIISDLENGTGTKISLSQYGNFYPGTNDRVCLISGPEDCLFLISDFIIEKVYEFAAKRNFQNRSMSKTLWFRVKLFIPQISVMKVIGKDGFIIENLKLKTGTVIRVSKRSVGAPLIERIVTIYGQREDAKMALRFLYEHVAKYTHGDYYKNVHYSSASGPIPNACGFDEALAECDVIYEEDSSTTNEKKSKCYVYEAYSKPSVSYSEYSDGLKTVLKEKSCSDEVINQSLEAFDTLIRHGVLEICTSLMEDFNKLDSRQSDDSNDNVHVDSTSREVNTLAKNQALPLNHDDVSGFSSFLNFSSENLSYQPLENQSFKFRMPQRSENRSISGLHRSLSCNNYPPINCIMPVNHHPKTTFRDFSSTLCYSDGIFDNSNAVSTTNKDFPASSQKLENKPDDMKVYTSLQKSFNKAVGSPSCKSLCTLPRCCAIRNSTMCESRRIFSWNFIPSLSHVESQINLPSTSIPDYASISST